MPGGFELAGGGPNRGAAMLRLGVVVLATAASACVTIPTGTARTLDKGKWQIQAGETGIFSKDTGARADGAQVTRSGGVTAMSLGAAYGVSDRVEVGAGVAMSVNYAVGSLSTKLALVRAPDASSGIDLSVAPSIAGWVQFARSSGAGTDESANGLVSLQLPLLLGLNLSGGHQVITGITAAGIYFGGGGDELRSVYAGASLGFAWKITDGFRFVPQLALGHLWNIYATTEPGNIEPDPWPLRGNYGQVSLGLLLGGD
jgi:hypothetical protein